MKFYSKYSYIIFVAGLLSFSASIAENSNAVLSGKDIKKQAQDFFVKNTINAEVLISDKRKFFPCHNKLNFAPRLENDWSSLAIVCMSPNWKIVLRTSAKARNKLQSKNENKVKRAATVVALSKNVSKGEVLDESSLVYLEADYLSTFGTYDDVKELTGRKTKTDLKKGTVVKTRHLEYRYSVNKDETVVIVLDNKMVSISTYGKALEPGQNGDMITVENMLSGKKFKAIVIDSKKVTPLTNM